MIWFSVLDFCTDSASGVAKQISDPSKSKTEANLIAPLGRWIISVFRVRVLPIYDNSSIDRNSLLQTLRVLRSFDSSSAIEHIFNKARLELREDLRNIIEL